MAFAGSIKREAVTQGWAYLIENATGQQPYIERTGTGNKISFRPGQAALFREYLNRAMAGSKEYDPQGINVDVALAPVIIPLAIQKTLGYIVAYTALVFFASRYMGK